MYLIILDPKVTKHDIPALANDVWQNIVKAVDKKLIMQPLLFSKPLAGELKDCRTLRVGDYRVIFHIDQDVIRILAMGHRKAIYDLAKQRVH